MLAQSFPDLSRSRFQDLIARGQVSVDGRTIVEARQPVKPGAEIAFSLPEAEPPAPAGESIPLTVLHEDDQVIVIDKPAGLVVHPAPGNASGTLVNALIAHCGDSLSGIGGVKRPGIVHRLDKDTSGVMVVAKTDRAHRSLSRQFAAHGRDGRLRRSYVALVWGAPERRQGTISAPLGRAAANRTRIGVRGDGREAVTRYRVLETFPAGGPARVALVRCELETGRTHQIRVHMAHVGHPLLGDVTYGSGFKSSEAGLPPAARQALSRLGRQALHAECLGFEHPASRKAMQFSSAEPEEFASLLKTLRGWKGDMDKD